MTFLDTSNLKTIIIRSYKEDLEICDSFTSEAVNKLYMKHRYISSEACSNPCKKMKISLNFQSKVPWHKQYVRFYMDPYVDRDEHILAYSSLNLFAEIGSYLGLTLGVSLMDLPGIFRHLSSFTVLLRKTEI